MFALKSGKAALALSAVVAITGCEFARVATFSADPQSGAEDPYRVALHVTSANASFTPTAGRFDPQFATVVAEQCGRRQAPTGRSFGAFAGVVAPFVIDQFIGAASSALQSRVEELADNSQKGYATRVVLDRNEMPRGGPNQCIIVERIMTSGGEDRGGVALVLRATREGSTGNAAFSLKPVYVELRETLAVTAAGAPVEISVAVAAKVARQGPRGPVVQDSSLGSFTIRQLAIGAPQTEFGTPVSSGLVAQTPDDADAIELSVAIVETGSEIPDAEKTQAEVKAFEGAVGPTLRDTILSSF